MFSQSEDPDILVSGNAFTLTQFSTFCQQNGINTSDQDNSIHKCPDEVFYRHI